MCIDCRGAGHQRQESHPHHNWMLGALVLGLFGHAGTSFTLQPGCTGSRVKDTETAVETVRGAITMYRAEHAGGCPDMNDLVDGQYLGSQRRLQDAWDQDFRIEYHRREVFVTSAGPDGRFGSRDDID